MTEFGLDCFAYRAKNRLTQKEMGQRCGVDRTMIINIENGRPVSKMTETKVRIVLDEDKQEIPTATNGIPLVAVNAPFYELTQLMEALTTCYNALVRRDDENQKKIERIRKLAEHHFPASKKNTYNWVRAEDRPPEKSGEYYTYGSNMGVYPLHFSAKNQLWNAYDTQTEEEALEHAIFGITHWFERPKAPVVPEPIPHEED